MARTIRRPKRRTTAAVPELFSSLTARDWSHIREVERRLQREYETDGDYTGESPLEEVMTSKGYINVGHDSDGGFVRAYGFLLHKDFWPRAVKKVRRVIRKRAR